MISTSFLFASLVAHALFITSVKVKTKFLPKLSNVSFWATHVYKKDIDVFIPNFNDTLFSQMSHSLKPHHFSLPLCYLMRMVLHMLEISLPSFPHPLYLHCRSTSDEHPIHGRLEMILIHQHHLLLQQLLPISSLALDLPISLQKGVRYHYSNP